MAKKKKKEAGSKAKAKAKSNKKAAASAKPAAGKTRLKPRAKAMAAPGIPAAGNDYAIWGISFWHYDPNWAYYYPVYDDQIDSSLELYVMGEATPEDYADTDIRVKIDLPDGTNVVAEAAAPHFDSLFYPTSWIATIPANSLNAATSYVVKSRHYQDKAAASSEFTTQLPPSVPPPTSGA